MAAQSTSLIAKQNCEDTPRRWYANEAACAALWSAYARQMHINDIRDDGAQRVNTRADYLFSLAQEHARSIGDDPVLLQMDTKRLYAEYVDDEALLRADIDASQAICNRIVKLDMQGNSTELRSYLCSSARTR